MYFTFFHLWSMHYTTKIVILGLVTNNIQYNKEQKQKN